MKKLDWYILKKFLGTFFFAILVFAAIITVIDLSEKMDELVKRKASVMTVIKYYRDFLPNMIALLYPLFIFIATIFFTAKLANQTEVIAILASGVSFPRFLRPYIIGGILLCGFSYIANHFIIPVTNKGYITFKEKYVDNILSQSNRNVHLRLSDKLYVYVQNYDFANNSGYRFTAETIEKGLLKEKLMADRVSYDSIKKVWNLYNVSIRTNDSLTEKLTFFPELSKTYRSFTPKDLAIDNQIMTTMTTPVLNDVIAREKLRGRENLNEYYVERYIRTSQPFAAFILVIIGACISSRKIRGGSGIHLAFGVVLCAVYIMLLQFTKTFSTKAGLNPLLAVWIPNIIFSFIALYFYRRQVK